jgi:hypothetical protein
MSGDHIAQGIDPRTADRILSSVSIQSLRRSKIVIWVAQRNYHSTLCNSHYCLLLMSIAELWIKNGRILLANLPLCRPRPVEEASREA